MNQKSRYRYEQRIKDLRLYIDRLFPYRNVVLRIYDGVQANGDTGNAISKKWLLAQFRELFK